MSVLRLHIITRNSSFPINCIVALDSELENVNKLITRALGQQT